jgi:hypothetical protein
MNINSGVGVTARNLGLKITWSGYAILYEWNPSYISRSDLATERTTDWYAPNGGQACWLQGVKLDIDTFGESIDFEVRGDSDAVIATLTIDHDGRLIEAFSWTPAFTHLVRIVPTSDAANWLVYSEPVWIAEPEPELAEIWDTQPTTFDWPQFGHIYRAQIAHRSTADITMTVTIDGVDFTYDILNSGGDYQKTYVTLQAIKGKSFQFKLQSAEPFRLYKRDLNVSCKAWSDVAAYQSATPFGSLSRLDGANI